MIQQNTYENVVRAYTGSLGCMCGCKGKYSEGGTRSAKIIFNKIINDPNHEYDAGAGCVVLTTETRQLVAYFE